MSPSPIRFFFFSDSSTTEIYTLSLHDALPISPACVRARARIRLARKRRRRPAGEGHTLRPHPPPRRRGRSEEHTSELQSQSNLVCRLLLEKKNARGHHRPVP